MDEIVHISRILALALLLGLLGSAQHGAAHTHQDGNQAQLNAEGAAAHTVYLPLIADGQPSNDPQSNPLTIGVTLDTDRTVGKTVAPTGGALSAIAADGTRFTLTLPPDALLSTESISLTPLSGANDLPLSGGLIAGVQLQPEGLYLLQPITLTIELASAVPPEEQVAFAYEQSGAEFHLYPAQHAPAVISMPLVHFSGYGLGRGTAANRQSILQHQPTAPSAQVEQQLALPGNHSASDSLQEWWDRYVSIQLSQAINDDSAFESALDSFILWRSRVMEQRLQSRFDHEQSLAFQWLAQALVKAVGNTFERCMITHDVAQAAKILRLVEWAAITPRVRLAIADADWQSMQYKMQSCARFELRFDTTVTYSSPHDSWTAHLTSVVALTPGRSIDRQPIGTADLAYRSFDFQYTQPTGCALLSTTHSGLLNVYQFEIDLNFHQPVPGLLLAYAPDGNVKPTEQTTVSCAAPQPPYTIDTADWYTNYYLLHQGIDECCYIPHDWDFSVAGLYATKSYQRSMPAPGNGTLSEYTRLELRHMPQR